MTGVEAISNGVPAFKPVEWKNARKVLGWLGRAARRHVHRDLVPRLEAPPAPEHQGDGDQPDRPCHRRHRHDREHRLLRHPGDDDADPGAGGEHVVRRLPPARQLPRPRPLPADAADQAGASPRLRQRHRGARGARDPGDDHLRCERRSPDPALRDRRVHLLHPVAGGHGQAPPHPEGGRAGRSGSGSTARARSRPWSWGS